MARLSKLGIASSLVTVVACQAFVGIESSELAPSDAGNPTLSSIDDAAANDPIRARDASDSPKDAPDDAKDDATEDATTTMTDCGAADARDGGPEADAPECSLGDRRCHGNTTQKCTTAGAWEDETACATFCRAATCETPPSCSGTATSCGSNADPRSCCASHLVEGGALVRDYDNTTAGHDDPTYTATVSDFLLDDFEVSVERFAHFVDAYPVTAPPAGTAMGSMPAPGSGKNKADPSDPGWGSTFPLPADRAALIAAVSLDPQGPCQSPTWGAPSHKPLSCANWYIAYAFCIWDGGRLPTEAEWNYAAAGGGGTDGERVYPFSVPPTSVVISASDAIFSPGTVADVGSLLPKGAGKWLQADLAGNLSEWVADANEAPYASNPCNDCTDRTPGADHSVRGGDFTVDPSLLEVASRTAFPPSLGIDYIGFRCARSK